MQFMFFYPASYLLCSLNLHSPNLVFTLLIRFIMIVYPTQLEIYEYGQKLRSCNDMPAKFPVDRGFGKHVSKNVNNRDTFSSGKLDVREEAKEGCPVNADPFLPWIHDFFPNAEGTVMNFIAQNKRRCNTGKDFWEDIHDLEPQVTIMQPVSVKRIDEKTANKLAPNMWSPKKK